MGLTDPVNKTEDHARRVREMFARISPRYDLLNHLLSGYTDTRWRRKVVEKLTPLVAPNARLLDVACGTGDLSIEFFEQTRARITGLDFCRPMLELAQGKTRDVTFVEGDALRLPFADETFDAITIGFGLRNLASVETGLRELRRPLKPGGWLGILEFSQPTNAVMRAWVRLYYGGVLPRIGGWLSGSRSAYEYLPDSISRFPDQERLATLMREAGFSEVSFENLTGGVAALHIGRKS